MGTQARAAIRTRWLSPTNYNPARISVTDDGGVDSRRIIVSWDSLEGNTDADKHASAARKFLEKHNKYANGVVEPGLSFGGNYYWTWNMK